MTVARWAGEVGGADGRRPDRRESVKRPVGPPGELAAAATFCLWRRAGDHALALVLAGGTL